VALIRNQRATTLHHGARLALRLGRFAEAGAFAERSLELERNPAALVLLGASRVLATRAGNAAYRLVRATWRLRPSTGNFTSAKVA
jgi:hypothetical protein